jgi:hypothetical protein
MVLLKRNALILGLVCLSLNTFSAEKKGERAPASAQITGFTNGYSSVGSSCSGEFNVFKKQGVDNIGVIRLRGVKNCSNYSLGGTSGKLEGSNQNRSGDIEFTLVPGKTMTGNLYLYSNTRQHQDILSLSVRTDDTKHRPPNRWSIVKVNAAPVKLASCGGTVELKNTNNQWNIIGKGIRNCNQFDILESNGDYVSYSAKDISSSNFSFTLPKKVYERGISFGDPMLDLFFGASEPNLVKVKFYNSFNRYNQDIVYLKFVDNGNSSEVNELAILSSDDEVGFLTTDDKD